MDDNIFSILQNEVLDIEIKGCQANSINERLWELSERISEALKKA